MAPVSDGALPQAEETLIAVPGELWYNWASQDHSISSSEASPQTDKLDRTRMATD